MRRAIGTSSGSERMSTTSAVSMATSVPAPMAMPRSAWAMGNVDAVADHRHPAAARLQFLDLGGLVAGQHLGDDGVDAKLIGDPAGGGRVVTGEHDDLDACLVQRPDRFGGGVACRVGQRDHADSSPVDRDENGGMAFCRQPVAAARQVAELDTFLGHELEVADEDPAAGDVGLARPPSTCCIREFVEFPPAP